MPKQQLEALVRAEFEGRITMRDSIELVDAVLRGIKRIVEQDGELLIKGLGRFRLTDTPPQTLLHPVTRQPIAVPPGKRVAFRPAESWKCQLLDGTASAAEPSARKAA